MVIVYITYILLEYKANFNLDRSSVLTGYCDYIVLLGQI